MPEFPLDQLTIRDGVLLLIDPSLPETEYMDTPPIRIEAKDKLVELEKGEVAYMFVLNHRADSIWTELLTSYLEGLSAEIQGAQLEIRCNPEELAFSYDKVKELLARTNQNYAELKAQLSERVAELDAERRANLQAREELSMDIRKQFDRLIL